MSKYKKKKDSQGLTDNSDIGDIVDIESSIYYKIQEFFGKLCSHSKDELVKILPDIIHGLHQNIDLHHAKPSVWGIF
jgi:hypothetical protein